MDNNSNDTLFGFEAISNMFVEDHSNTTTITPTPDDPDAMTDEELEELKRQSAKARPATPGAKNKKQEPEEDEVDDDDDVNDIDDNIDDDDKTKNKKTKKVEEDDDVNNIDDNDDDVDEEESSKVTALFDAIAEELEWEFDDDEEEEKPKTVEELVNYFKEVIKEQSVPQYANEDVAKLDEFVRNGGDLNDYFTLTPEIDYENFDTTIESNQKQIVKMLLAEKGFNEKQIARKIEKYEDAGILEDEAEDALEAMKEIEETKKEQLLEDQRKQHEQMVARQQKFMDDVVGEINAMKDIRGIKVPEKDKKALLAYIFKADANGKTQYQKDYSKSVKNLIESAYFTMKGDTLLDTAKKMGTSSAIKNLKQSLRSTGVSKGTRRINTNSSNSIFSRAVQLL
ncbi:hypothetical protein [uncultured phage cr1_1]|jgi:hypothetical protein|uniref:Regulatory protein n=2 Tax=Culoivirus TaxID=2942992 RepID=A0A7M1RWG5_9CAUD|nr:hypothetical protein KNV27_gp010 [uncultured phage cr55_1]YP_010110622.1 hypothetical protein KNV31_gp013 [uncultured phage cr1_1]QOR58085.1 hypothetical protein [uncultured phage cr55_1]QOR58464.1 hypothetical protein [uncultured phage cr1_1]UVX92344.1 MAG: hypothetical protein [Bacteriophage sp.]